MVLVRPEDNRLNGSESQRHLTSSVDMKTPKRVLHFCDGVLEEYSSDEEDTKQEQSVVDASSLTWGPWFWYKAWGAGSSTLSVVDTVGEFLANLFGITTPRYYFELEEHKRREREEMRRKEEEQGWSQPSKSSFSLPLGEINSKSMPVDV